MIITEYFTTRKDGVILNRTYSSNNCYIEREGVLYSEAIDPADSGRVYTETTVRVTEEEKEQAETEIIN